MNNTTYLECLATFGVGGAHPGGLQLTKKLLANENIHRETSVLDAGCGTGQTSAYLAQKFLCNVTSLDSNSTMLEKAKQRFSALNLAINVVPGNVEMLPFGDQSFDVVLSESVASFTNSSITLQEFKRVLKPKGLLLAIEMVLENSLPEGELKSLVDFYGMSRLLRKTEWRDLLQSAGFQHISFEPFKEHIDDYDIDTAPDFTLSETIDHRHLEILSEHKRFMATYRDTLGFCIFRCCVD